MIKAGIIGSDSIVTGELIRVLINHPDVTLKWVSGKEPGTPVSVLHKGLTGECDIFVTQPKLDEVQVVFVTEGSPCITPQDTAAEHELKIIDLTRTAGEGFTYGMSEMNRKFMVHDCNKVTLPSPQAMGVLPALIPLAKNLLLNSDIAVEMEVGGFIPIFDPGKLSREVTTALQAMQQSFNAGLSFEMRKDETLRGLKTRITMPCNIERDTIVELFNDYYDDHNFVFVSPQCISTHDVINTNKCLINISSNDGMLTITTVIDAMLKGDAGNAVHVMNLLFGLHEKTGLALKAQVF